MGLLPCTVAKWAPKPAKAGYNAQARTGGHITRLEAKQTNASCLNHVEKAEM
jgi:hypothetical protein